MVESSVNEFTLLCEGCGYEIEGLDHESACPECGRALSESLPERRIGSPWQRACSGSEYIRTCALVLRHPRSCWDGFVIGSDRNLALRMWHVLLAVVMSLFGVGIAFVAYALWDHLAVTTVPPHTAEDFLLMGMIMFAMLVMLGFILGFTLFLLIAIESAGIRWFGRLHRRRITRDVSNTIVAHASVGWFVGGVLSMLGVWIGTGLNILASEYTWARYELMFAMPLLLPIAGMLVGMLLFETLTWLGVMRLKYANREQPQVDERHAD